MTATRPFLPLYSLLDRPVSWTDVPTGRLDIFKVKTQARRSRKSFAYARLTCGRRGRACGVCGRETSAWREPRAEIKKWKTRTLLPIENLHTLPVDDLHERRRQVGPLGERRVQDVVRRRAGRPQDREALARVFGGLPQHGEKSTF